MGDKPVAGTVDQGASTSCVRSSLLLLYCIIELIQLQPIFPVFQASDLLTTECGLVYNL